MTRPYSAALPIAYVVLRILVVLNWLFGAAILALLLVMPNEEWIMRAFKLSPGPEAERLVAMVETVRAGDPFVVANPYRLNVIAWLLLALQLLSIMIGAIGTSVSTAAAPVHLDAGFSVNGWLAVLLTFILARVFAEGTMMRDDLEGTV